MSHLFHLFKDHDTAPDNIFRHSEGR
jgi:hypothetical protein